MSSFLGTHTDMNIAVYFRIRPSEPTFSDRALDEQQDAVGKWLAAHPSTIVSEYIESETDDPSRPRLVEAIAACKENNATLLIARTEAIGNGAPFSPRIGSVPIAIAPKAIREIGHTIPAPLDAKAGLFLYFPDHRAASPMPVYLCNGTSEAIRDAAVSIGSITSKMLDDDAMPSSPSLTTALFRVPVLPPRNAILIDHYDPMSDGDFITVFEVAFCEQQQRALVGSGGLSAPLIAMNSS
jgi:hypothetical protein